MSRLSPSILLLFLATFSSCNKKQPQLVKFTGETQGTYYVVTYYDIDGRNFQPGINQLLKGFDEVASMWVDQSIISRINRNETDKVENEIFSDLYEKSWNIYEKSSGAFDPTIGPLVNAWGFGFTDRMKIDSSVVDSLLPLVNFSNVSIISGRIMKDDPRIQFDFNAIAQGYSVDLIGQFLEQKGINIYLIDIGGEVLGKGLKPNGDPWKVGIEKPADHAQYGDAINAIVTLRDRAIATSGNYRKFYEKDGVRYSHTIDPATGYPVQHTILSVSVMAPDCATADGWATAFMVMGLDDALNILDTNKYLEAYFIYTDPEDNTVKTYITKGFSDKLVLNK